MPESTASTVRYVKEWIDDFDNSVWAWRLSELEKFKTRATWTIVSALAASAVATWLARIIPV